MFVKNHKSLKNLNIILFMIYFFTWYTPFLYEVYSRTIFLFVITWLSIIYIYSNHKSITISKNDYVWIVFLLILGIGVIKNFHGYTLETIVIYIMTSIILLSFRSDLDDFNWDLVIQINRFFLFVHTIFVYFQVLLPRVYLKFILPFFEVHLQDLIPKLMNVNAYNGITSQTAYNSGYYIFGIGLLVSFYGKNKKINIIDSILIILSVLALILTGKRSHIFFSVISFLMTYIIISKTKDEFKRKAKKSFISIMLLSMSIIIILFIGKKFHILSIEVFYKKLELTARSILIGDFELLTSGRTKLWSASISLFKENPIFGAGWMVFRDTSKGILFKSLSHPHNIYLQVLTELGIIGFIIFVYFIVFSFVMTLQNLRKLQNQSRHLEAEISMVIFCIYIQIFLMLYGLTGNLLTDYIYIIMYIISIGLVSLIQAKK